MLPDDWAGRLTLIKLIGGAVAGTAAAVAGWASLGGPVPATRGWTEAYHASLAERAEMERLMFALDKALTELEPGDTRDALLAQREALQARLDG
jgi:hypothetical protein